MYYTEKSTCGIVELFGARGIVPSTVTFLDTTVLSEYIRYFTFKVGIVNSNSNRIFNAIHEFTKEKNCSL